MSCIMSRHLLPLATVAAAALGCITQAQASLIKAGAPVKASFQAADASSKAELSDASDPASERFVFSAVAAASKLTARNLPVSALVEKAAPETAGVAVSVSVPEPLSLTLLGLGLASIYGARRLASRKVPAAG